MGFVPSCHRAFMGISCVQNLFSWIFCWSKIFSCGYFERPKFSLVGIFIFTCWPHEKKWHRNISQTTFFYSKSISTIANGAYIREVFDLLNYLCYFAALVCTSCIFSRLYLGKRISSLVIEIYSYCKTRPWLYCKV